MYGRNGRYYDEPLLLDAATITPQLVAADATKTAFDLDGTNEMIGQLNVHAHYQTALTGANNDLVYIARTPGAAGKDVSVAYVDPAANNAPLVVSVLGTAITVSLATGVAGAITSTASQIKAAIEALAAADALVVVSLAGADTGAGIVTALTATNLAEPTGTNPTLDATIESSIDAGATYFSAGTFAQKTIAAIEGKVFVTLGDRARVKLDVGGTDPVFAVSFTAKSRR